MFLPTFSSKGRVIVLGLRGCSERVQLARRTTAYHVGTGSTSSLVSVAFKIRVVKFCWFLAADVPFSSANYVSYRSSSPSHSIQCFIMLRHQLTCNRHDGSEFCMFDVKKTFSSFPDAQFV